MKILQGSFKTKATGRQITAHFAVAPAVKPITSKRKFVAKLTTSKGERIGRTYGSTHAAALKRLKERFQAA